VKARVTGGLTEYICLITKGVKNLPVDEKCMLDKSQQEAKDWVAKAIAFYKTSGRATALAEFSKPNGPFIQGEMYIFVLDQEGTLLAHGLDEKYIGQHFIDLQDSAGKKFNREIIDKSNAIGSGWIDYIWYDPSTQVAELKHVYFEKVDDLIFCSGVYKELWEGPKWVTALLRNP
jgi:cytochrome c